MLKLITDPTAYPIREASLSRPDGRLALVRSSFAQSDRPLFFDRPDGGSNVLLRRRRTNLELTLEGITPATYRELEDLAQESAFGRPALPVYVAPNFDRSTRVWAPLTGSLSCLAEDLDAGTLTKQALTFTRGTDAQHFNEIGDVETTPAGTPRFVRSVLGRGLYVGAIQDENRATPTHPTAGDLGFAVTSGLGSISWDSTIRTPNRSAGGAARVHVPAGDTTTLTLNVETGDGSTDGTLWRFAVWISGRVGDSANLWGGFSLDTSSAPISSEPGVWTANYVDQYKTNATTTATFAITVTAGNADLDFHVGLISLQRLAGTLDQSLVLSDWQDAGARSADLVESPEPLPADGYTFAFVGRFPRNNTQAYFVRQSAGGVTSYALFFPTPSQQSFLFSPDSAASAAGYPRLFWDNSEAAAYAGQPFHVVCRFAPSHPDPAVAGATLELAVGGKTFRAHTPAADLEVGEYTESSRLYLGGGDSAASTRSLGFSHFRLDRRAWSDAEMQQHRALFTRAALLELLERTAGRRFAFEALEGQPLDGRPDALRAVLRLRELDHDPDFVVA